MLVMLTKGVVAVLANQEGLSNEPLVQQWALWLGIASTDTLLPPIKAIFEAAALAACAIWLLNLWLNRRLAAAIGSDLSCETYLRTLYKTCAVHLAPNRSS